MAGSKDASAPFYEKRSLHLVIIYPTVPLLLSLKYCDLFWKLFERKDSNASDLLCNVLYSVEFNVFIDDGRPY
jgi:hypothetical protein